MKVTEGKKGFAPVTIVLETELELEALTELVGNIVGTMTPARVFTDALWDKLNPIASVRGGGSKYFIGSLRVKE